MRREEIAYRKAYARWLADRDAGLPVGPEPERPVQRRAPAADGARARRLRAELAQLDEPEPTGGRCEDCGVELTPDNHVRIELFREQPDAPGGLVWDSTKQKLVARPHNARAGGRRFRMYDLCRRCKGEALRRRSMNGTVTENGVKRPLKTRERVPPKRGGRPRLLTDDELRAAHLLYERHALSRLQIARALAASRDKGTASGYDQSLLYGWRRLGLTMRPTPETVSLVRGGTGENARLVQQRDKRRCEATTRHRRRCGCWASPGSRFCWNHRTRAVEETAEGGLS